MKEVTNTAELNEVLDAQPRLQPGEEGWWKVWGARPHNVRAGDAVVLDADEGWLYVQETYEPKTAPMRVGWVVDGERMTYGALAPVVVLRRETHNTLA